METNGLEMITTSEKVWMFIHQAFRLSTSTSSSIYWNCISTRFWPALLLNPSNSLEAPSAIHTPYPITTSSTPHLPPPPQPHLMNFRPPIMYSLQNLYDRFLHVHHQRAHLPEPPPLPFLPPPPSRYPRFLDIMLFDDGDASLLKKWIVKRLEDMYASSYLTVFFRDSA